MIYFKNTLLIIFSCMLFSCAKDKLTGDYKPLVGKWRLVKTTDQETGQVIYHTGNLREIQFLEKGKYAIYKSGDKITTGYTLIDADHLKFKNSDFIQKMDDELSYKAFHPSDLHGDSLFLPDHGSSQGFKPKDEVYLRE